MSALSRANVLTVGAASANAAPATKRACVASAARVPARASVAFGDASSRRALALGASRCRAPRDAQRGGFNVVAQAISEVRVLLESQPSTRAARALVASVARSSRPARGVARGVDSRSSKPRVLSTRRKDPGNRGVEDARGRRRRASSRARLRRAPRRASALRPGSGARGRCGAAAARASSRPKIASRLSSRRHVLAGRAIYPSSSSSSSSSSSRLSANPPLTPPPPPPPLIP